MYGVVIGVLAVIWVYTLCESVISPPVSGYYTSDENFIADSGVFMWYGNTPRCLDWPAAPSVLLFFLMFGTVALCSIVANMGSFESIFDALEHFDAQTYAYLSGREDYILAGRTIQLIVVGLTIFFTVRFIFRSHHPMLTSLLKGGLSMLIVTSYIVWFNAPFLRPEALAGSLFIFLLCRLFFAIVPDRRELLFWSVLFGVIVAERLIFVFVSPIVFFRIYECLPFRKWSGVFRAAGLTLLTFIVFCPFILTDPFVILKAFGGGILAKMQDAPMKSLFNMDFIGLYFENPVSYLVVILAITGAVSLLVKRKLFGWVVSLNLLLFLFLVLRSAKIYDTHVLPAGVITLFLAAFGIVFLVGQLPGRRLLWASVPVLVISFYNLKNVYAFQVHAHKPDTFHLAYDWVCTLPEGTSLVVPPGRFEYVLARTQEGLRRVFDANQDEVKMQKKIRFLLGAKDDEKVSFPIVANSFLFEDEALYETQYRILMKFNHLSKKRFDYDTYTDNNILANTYVLKSQATDDFKKGRYTYFISEENQEGLGEPFRTFSTPGSSTYYVYKTTGNPQER